MELIKLDGSDGTWAALETEWGDQCAAAGEDLEDWGISFLAPLRDLINSPHRGAGVYGLKCDGSCLCICQVNSTPLPGIVGKTLRVRFLTLCPEYDLGKITIEQYIESIGTIFTSIVELSQDGEMKSDHIKFHLRSPADRTFFSAYSNALNKTGIFSDVAVRGTWFYITLS